MPLLPVFAADGAWPSSPRQPVVATVEPGVLRIEPGPGSGLPRVAGVLAPGAVDAHVHLGLVDPAGFARSAVLEVLDCGWIPPVAAGWRRHPTTGGIVRALGPFHTPPGGYPRGRAWAPDSAVREVADAGEARAAVDAGSRAGFDGLKAVVHAATPFPAGVLETLVGAAHAAGMRVHVHAEGPGAARRAVESGADVLVHTPWSERLPDDLIATAAVRMTWTSTLAIHSGASRAIALDNAARFVAAGGVLRYGTDLGNGPAPAGLKRDELELLARVLPDPDRFMAAVSGPAPFPAARAIVVPGPWPATAAGLVERLMAARRLDEERRP